jgi:hypothetical protein
MDQKEESVDLVFASGERLRKRRFASPYAGARSVREKQGGFSRFKPNLFRHRKSSQIDPLPEASGADFFGARKNRSGTPGDRCRDSRADGGLQNTPRHLLFQDRHFCHQYPSLSSGK